MNTLFDSKQDRSSKGLITTLLATITLLAATTATLLLVTFSGNASADSGAAYPSTASHTGQTSSEQKVDYEGLMLFDGSHLKGALR